MGELQLTFLASDKSKKTLRLANFDTVDPVVAKEVMAEIIATDLIQNKDVHYYTEALSAKITQTTTQTLFDTTQA